MLTTPAGFSRWAPGGQVRTVNALVHVDKWDGPGRVDFSFKLEGDPVEGGGSYIAAENGPAQSEVTLQVRILGSGPLAPMWEAMSPAFCCRRIAKSFATQLKDEIESLPRPPLASPAQPSEANSIQGFGQQATQFTADAPATIEASIPSALRRYSPRAIALGPGGEHFRHQWDGIADTGTASTIMVIPLICHC